MDIDPRVPRNTSQIPRYQCHRIKTSNIAIAALCAVLYKIHKSITMQPPTLPRENYGVGIRDTSYCSYWMWYNLAFMALGRLSIRKKICFLSCELILNSLFIYIFTIELYLCMKKELVRISSCQLSSLAFAEFTTTCKFQHGRRWTVILGLSWQLV